MTLRGTNRDQSRPYNRRIVLEFIRTHGPCPRAEIARRVGLTVQTVSTIVRELEEAGYLTAREAPREGRGRGAPAQLLHINPDGGHAIGIDVSPFGVNAGLMNLGGALIGTRSVALRDPSPDQAFAAIAELVEAIRALRPGARILGLGMAIPGPFDVEAMSFVGPTTLSGWAGVDLRARLAALCGLPAYVAVDTVASAEGVRLYGEGAGLREFYYMHMGAGLGGTLVLGDKAHRGAHGNAGEVGHMPLVPGGLPCVCGGHGCLERYVSMDALGRRPAGQDLAAWLQDVAPVFRRALTVIENLFDPQTVIIGGIAPPEVLEGLAALGGDLPVSVAQRSGRSLARVIAATDRHAVLRGAAALAVSGVLAPRHDPGQQSEDPGPGQAPDALFSNGMAA